LRLQDRFGMMHVGVFALSTLSVVACAVDPSPSTSATAQEVIASPLPGNLNLVLNAKTTVSIGAFANINGDVGSTGPNGSVLFDVGSSQGFGGFNVLASTVTVNTQASVGHVFGNTITVNGFASQQSLGFDPSRIPQIPAATPAAPGTTNVSTKENQARQLCPGRYGAISLGVNSTLNLNGGVYQVTKLTLADGARLEPSEPVVILVSGGVTTGIGSAIQPSAQALNPMTAANIRIEVGGAVTLGDSNQIRAHLLVNGKLTAGKQLGMTGAAWAKSISLGPNSFLTNDSVFATQAPQVPPPCNDNNACTVDTCVGGGTAVAFCSNAVVPAGTSCSDGNACNGEELCDAAAQCQPGTIEAAGTACPDGDLCNGDEACNGFGTCEPGTPPVVDDHDVCTADACDAEAGIVHTPLPDGTTCNGTGTCSAGTCVGGAGPSSGTFPFSATGTNSATQNTTNFDLQIVAGQQLTVGTCGLTGGSSIGDTFLRLFDPANNPVAADDDGCGNLLSLIVFTAPTSGTYEIRVGCFDFESCSGTVGFSLTGL